MGGLAAFVRQADEDSVWGFEGSIGPLHAVTFSRIQMILAMSEDLQCWAGPLPACQFGVSTSNKSRLVVAKKHHPSHYSYRVLRRFTSCWTSRWTFDPAIAGGKGMEKRSIVPTNSEMADTKLGTTIN